MSDNDAVEKFHKHLDTCEQCRNHPFNPCPLGKELLHSAANKAKETLENMGPVRSGSPLSEKIQKQLDQIVKDVQSELPANDQDIFTSEFVKRFAERVPVTLAVLMAQIFIELLLEQHFNIPKND